MQLATPSSSARSSTFVFLTAGPLKSAAYNRARFMSSELAKRGFESLLVVDDTADNAAEVLPAIDDRVQILRVRTGNRLRNIVARRRLLAKVRPDYVVQLSANSRGLLTLVGTTHRIIGEWDEPHHLREVGLLQRWYFIALSRWLKRRAHLRVACTSALCRDEGGFDTYIPHGDYLEGVEWDRPLTRDGPATYMGNLYPNWDHSLLFEGAERAAQRGSHPQIRIIGGGVEYDRWKDFCRSHSLSNIEFVGPIYGGEMLTALAQASVLLYPARDTPINRTRCSSKLFAYAAAGSPVLAHDVGEARAILGDAMIAVQPGEDLIAALEEYEANPGRRQVVSDTDLSYASRAEELIAALGVTAEPQRVRAAPQRADWRSYRRRLWSGLQALLFRAGFRLDRVGNAPKDAFAHQSFLLRDREVSAIIDVGANVGQVARCYRDEFPAARIFSFEPYDEPFAELTAWAERDGNVVTEKIALAAHYGSTDFYVNTLSATNSTLPLSGTVRDDYGLADLQTTSRIQVKTETLDNYARRMGLDHIDILKIDVQGGELPVLDGAEDLLRRGVIRLVYLEVMFREAYAGQALWLALADRLVSAGFAAVGFHDIAYSPTMQAIQGDMIFVRSNQGDADGE